MLSKVDRKGGRAVARRAGLGGIGAALLAAGIVAPAVLGVEPAPEGGTADVREGRGADPPGEVPELPPPAPGRPVPLETYEQAGSGRGHRVGRRGAGRCPPGSRAGGRARAQARPVADARGDRDARAWAEAGAPQGDPKDMPPPPQFPTGWKLGPPDLILSRPRASPSPPRGRTSTAASCSPRTWRDTYLAAIDFRPGNRGVVHHITAYIDTSGPGRNRDAADPGRVTSRIRGRASAPSRQARLLERRARAEPRSPTGSGSASLPSPT